jgi:hypothetical protein
MAVYKIFPEKSATLYSYYPTLNTGLDEILELSTFESAESTNEVSRIIIQFPSSEISDIINNKVSGAAFDAYLKLYLADATSLPLDYTIFSHPLASNWNVGTGRLANLPITTDGVSWGFIQESGSGVWFNPLAFPSGQTGSYQSGSNIGGGLWWTGSQYVASQSFNRISSKDIELKVTNTVNAWNSSSISNYGFILKHSSSIEFTTASKFETKYFSDTTHTIYPPALEIRWNDFSYNIGTLQTIDSDLYVTSLGNNKNSYQQDSVQRFRINVRAKYPPRLFQTSSFGYALVNYALPTSSYWSIKDLDTEEIIVDYDTTYTKISCDQSGSYFNVYMNGLEPERYYKLLFKSVLSNGEVIVFDENYYFKVVR